jgi:hypothetical protein
VDQGVFNAGAHPAVRGVQVLLPLWQWRLATMPTSARNCRSDSPVNTGIHDDWSALITRCTPSPTTSTPNDYGTTHRRRASTMLADTCIAYSSDPSLSLPEFPGGQLLVGSLMMYPGFRASKQAKAHHLASVAPSPRSSCRAAVGRRLSDCHQDDAGDARTVQRGRLAAGG